jgi:putative phosphoesterase
VAFRLGIISDVHADLGAFQATLEQLDALGVDQIICAGDVVDGGDQPEQVIALLRDRDIPTVVGNHDRWALRRHDDGEPEHDGDARKLHLSPGAVAWLKGLPKEWRRTIEGVRVVVIHGTPSSDMDGVYPETSGSELERVMERAEADVLIAGHTHVPLLRHVSSGRLVINAGALWRQAEAAAPAMLLDPGGGPSRPAERPQGGYYGVLELPSMRWTLHQLK